MKMAKKVILLIKYFKSYIIEKVVFNNKIEKGEKPWK